MVFLLTTKTLDIILSHEHLDFVWLDYDNAINKITYKNAKDLLKKSKEFLNY